MNANHEKALHMIGLAQKAGKIASGAFAAEKAIKCKQAKLVILSSDASDQTKKRFQNMCQYRHIPAVCMENMETLGHSIGKADRSVLAVLEDGFSAAILRQLDQDDARR